MAERLQKILSAAGIASRRRAEELIAADRVQVNGERASLGDSAEINVDSITVDGKPILTQQKRYLALNKPAGYVTTLSDDRGRPTVADLIDLPQRVYPVGRLDLRTEGLLLLTNDGEFAERAAHPRYEVEKTYFVTVRTRLSARAVSRLRSGVQLEDGPASATDVRVISPDRMTLELTIHEGRNRIVRRMLETVGSPAKRLVRTRIGPIELNDLPPGKWRNLTRREINALRKGAKGG